jgi:UDP-GlcNAc:undecaprenyl-phosphate GlcNAc-1-phosphate transferase
MKDLLIISASLALAIGGTPLLRHLAGRTGVVDRPGGHKLHLQPMPLLGGLAMYAAVMLALLVLDRFYVRQSASILIGATLVSFLGLWDDRRGMRPLIKLAGQLWAAGILVVAGINIQLFDSHIGNGLVTLIWVVGITNSMNFLDNMDGLAGGVAAIASATFLVLALLNGQALVAPLAAALLGASVGFLRYNLNPASIFMGDSGSLFLGYALAATAIKLRFPGNTPEVTWMVPVIVLGVPVFDTGLVLLSRLRRGVNPFTTGGHDHLSHRLAASTSRRQAVVRIWALALGLGLLGVIVSLGTWPIAYTCLFVLAITSLGALMRLEFMHPPGRFGLVGGVIQPPAGSGDMIRPP